MALMLGCPKIKNIHTYNMENSVSKQQTIRLKMEIKIIWKTQWLICEYIISEIIHEKHAKELPHSDFIFKTIRTFELFFGYLPISQLCCTQIVDLVWDQHPVFMPAEPAGLNMISACSCARISEDQAIDMLVWALCFHHGMLGLGIGEVISAQDIMYSNCCVDANFRKVNQRPNFFLMKWSFQDQQSGTVPFSWLLGELTSNSVNFWQLHGFSAVQVALRGLSAGWAVSPALLVNDEWHLTGKRNKKDKQLLIQNLNHSVCMGQSVKTCAVNAGWWGF